MGGCIVVAPAQGTLILSRMCLCRMRASTQHVAACGGARVPDLACTAGYIRHAEPMRVVNIG